MKLRALLAVPVTLVALGSPAGPAAAAPVFTPPAAIGDPMPFLAADDVLTGPDGRATFLLASGDQNGAPHVAARVRMPGAALGPAIELAPAGLYGTAGVDAAGTITVAWFEAEILPGPTYNIDVFTRTLAPDGTLGPVVPLGGTDDIGFSQPVLSVAVAPAGHTVVAWQLKGTAHVASHRAGQPFPDTATALPATNVAMLRAAVEPGGAPLVAYTAGAASQPYVARLPGGQGPPELVALGRAGWNANELAIAAEADGTRVHVRWNETAAGNLRELRGATVGLAAFATTEGPATLSAPGEEPRSVSVVAAGARVVTAWTDDEDQVRAHVRDGGPLGPADTVELSADGDSAFLAASGARVAVTYRSTAAPTRVAVRTLEDGGWSAPALVSPAPAVPGDFPIQPRIGVDPAGNVSAAWTRNIGTDKVVEVAYGDADGAPRLAPGPFPAAGALGAPLTFGVRPTDWLPVTVAWDFGDGTTAAGPTATHAFATAGTRTVTATATDAAGQAAALSQAVTVPNGAPSATIKRLRKRRILRGTAADDAGVAAVEVSLVRRRGARCAHLRTTKPRFTAPRRCGERRWLAATGTAKWKLALQRKLPAGRYVVRVRAIDAAGVEGQAKRPFRLR